MTPTPFSVAGVRKTQLGRRQLGLQGPETPQEWRQHLGVERGLLGPEPFTRCVCVWGGGAVREGK